MMVNLKMLRILIILLSAFAFSMQCSGQTTEEIIATHLNKIGGEENWLKVKSIEIEYKLQTDAGTMFINKKIIRKKKYRSDLKFESRIPAEKDKKYYLLLNDQGGFKYMPDTHDKVVAMDSIDLMLAREDMDYEDPFIQYRQKGTEIKQLEMMYEGDQEYFKFHLRMVSGREFICLLDSKTYLIHRMTEINSDVDNNRIYGAFKTIDGLVFPQSITGSFGEQELILVRINPVFSDAVFKISAPMNYR